MSQFYHKITIFLSVNDLNKVVYFSLVNFMLSYFLGKSFVSMFPMILHQNCNLKHQYPVKCASNLFLYLNLLSYKSMINIKHNFIYLTVLFLDFKFKIRDIVINIFRNSHGHHHVQLWQDYLILTYNSLN